MATKATLVFLTMFILICALPASGAIPLASAQEDAPLGEDLATRILSDVLDGNADDESNQDSTNAATVNPNQDQTVDQDNVGELGDDTTDLSSANVAVPIGTPINVEEDEVLPECPPGFTLNNNGQCEQTITQDPSCPTDFTFNPETNRCESSIDPSCPTVGDFTFNPETNRCESSIAPECTVGTVNPETNQCIVSTDFDCPTDTDLNTGTDRCEADPDCPTDTDLNTGTNLCEADPDCPTDTDLNTGTDRCEADPACEAGTFNAATDLCESSTFPECTVGTFNTATNQCDTDPACEAGTFNAATHECIVSREPECTVGTFNPTTHLCEQRQTLAPT